MSLSLCIYIYIYTYIHISKYTHSRIIRRCQAPTTQISKKQPRTCKSNLRISTDLRANRTLFWDLMVFVRHLFLYRNTTHTHATDTQPEHKHTREHGTRERLEFRAKENTRKKNPPTNKQGRVFTDSTFVVLARKRKRKNKRKKMKRRRKRHNV